MNNIFLLLIFALATLNTAVSQNDWSTIRIQGFGKIDLPPNMEIQGGIYRTINEKLKEINGVSSSKVIFQQSNLNKGSISSFDTYARVFIRTETEYSGAYPELSEFSISPSELDEINAMYKNEIYTSAKRVNATILSWYPAEKNSLNGQKCISLGYKRKLGINPPVLAKIYFFYNYDRLHVLTFEYRIEDENIWKSTFRRIKQSINIQ